MKVFLTAVQLLYLNAKTLARVRFRWIVERSAFSVERVSALAESRNASRMKPKFVIAALLMNCICLGVMAQAPPLVYPAENTGAAYPLPPLPALDRLPRVEPLTDPFMWSDGSGRTVNFSDWARRRNEIKAEIENYEIGAKPVRPDTITATWIPGATPATGVLQVLVTVNGQTLTLNSNVSLPAAGTGPFPAVIGMNSLNGSIPADIFTSRNIARITFSHNQVTTYPTPQATDPYFRLYPQFNRDNIGQYSAWAWGISRIIDGLQLVQADLPIDLQHLAVTGCSYAGKMALFAGAFDERIALTIAQESGGGGAPAWRVSETLGDVEKLGATSHEWFKESMFQFAGSNVQKLPHDHHELMAMVAPRALLVTGNTDFTWLANPSCYVSARAAHEVWKTFGVGDRFGFYIDGGHGHCAIPTAQRPAIEAFVDKFLLGNTNAHTNVTVNPYPTLDYQRWYQWWGTGNPVLPAEPVGIRIWMEPECATVGSDWQVITDTAASHGKYVVVNGLNSTAAAPGASGTIVFPFTIDSAASYNLMARLNCASANDDSYWVKFDDGPYVTINNLATSGWQWIRLTSANLSVGPHTLTIAYREDGAQLDKILLTTSGATITGKGTQGSNCGLAPVIAPGQAFAVNEKINKDSVVGQVVATDPDAETEFQNWKITGGTGDSVFAIDALTGKLLVKDSSLLDFESLTRTYTLTLTVTDGYNKSGSATITINIANANDNIPAVTPNLRFALDGGVCNELGAITVSDADDTNDAGFTTYHWQLVGGSGAGIFAVNATTGRISIADLAFADLARDSFMLLVTVSDGVYTSATQSLTVTIPDKVKVCHNGKILIVSKLAVLAHMLHGDCLGACGSGPDYPALKVIASPNPTNTSFLVTIKTGNPTQPVSLKVYNAAGNIIEQRQQLQTGQSLRVGQDYRAGLYFVECTQGVDKEVLLLLKLR